MQNMNLYISKQDITQKDMRIYIHVCSLPFTVNGFIARRKKQQVFIILLFIHITPFMNPK